MPSACTMATPNATMSGSIPGGAPGEVSMKTQATARSGLRDHDPARHHAAHRVPEQPQVAEVVGVGDRERVGREPIEAVGGGVVGRVARPVPTVVEHDHAVIDREGVDVVGEVLLGAAESVDQEEPGRVFGARGDGRELHAVVDRHRPRHAGHRARTLPGARVNRPPGTP